LVMRVSRPTKKNSKVSWMMLFRKQELRWHRPSGKRIRSQTTCRTTRILSRLLRLVLGRKQHKVRCHHRLDRKGDRRNKTHRSHHRV
jgi:hypothetical protein